MEFLTAAADYHPRSNATIYRNLVAAHQQHDSVECALYRLVRDAFAGAGGSGRAQYVHMSLDSIASTIVSVLSDHDAKCRHLISALEITLLTEMINWYGLQGRYVAVRHGSLDHRGRVIQSKLTTNWLELIIYGFLHQCIELIDQGWEYHRRELQQRSGARRQQRRS